MEAVGISPPEGGSSCDDVLGNFMPHVRRDPVNELLEGDGVIAELLHACAGEPVQTLSATLSSCFAETRRIEDGRKSSRLSECETA